MTTVLEILGPNRLTVSPSMPISDVAQKMKDHSLDMIAVCENGRFRGIITEKVIISQIVAASQDPKREQAESLMISNTPKISPGADVIEAGKMMASHRIAYLPVVQNGKFFGILTLDNLAKGSLAAAVIVLAQRVDDQVPMNARWALARA
jgi:signal-transduction protein with cAMP-binding, CBS, and nucleotidyltransferase domain